MENKCIFCKIIRDEAPSYKVYEDEHTLAFLNIHPMNQGHTLVVPKIHITSLEELDQDTLTKLILSTQKVAGALKNALNLSGYNIKLNNGQVAGQIIPHFHFHIIPRYEHDGLDVCPRGEYKNSQQAQDVSNKIKQHI